MIARHLIQEFDSKKFYEESGKLVNSSKLATTYGSKAKALRVLKNIFKNNKCITSDKRFSIEMVYYHHYQRKTYK